MCVKKESRQDTYGISSDDGVGGKEERGGNTEGQTRRFLCLLVHGFRVESGEPPETTGKRAC